MATLDLSASNILWLAAAAAVVVLWLLLVASFVTRAQVFCQYLEHMTGITLLPRAVKRVYRAKGQGGVRDLLIDLLIRQDLADPERVVTPDSKPDTSVFEGSG